MALGTVATIAGTAFSAYGQMQQASAMKAAGRASMQTAEYNKSVRDRNARVAEQEANHCNHCSIGTHPATTRIASITASIAGTSDTASSRAGIYTISIFGRPPGDTIAATSHVHGKHATSSGPAHAAEPHHLLPWKPDAKHSP